MGYSHDIIFSLRVSPYLRFSSDRILLVFSLWGVIFPYSFHLEDFYLHEFHLLRIILDFSKLSYLSRL